MYNYIIVEDVVVRQSYESAHRYTDVAVKAGLYPMERKYSERTRQYYWTTGIPGVITGSNYSSRFCGNPIGREKIDTDVGEETTISRYFEEGFYINEAIRKGLVAAA